MVKTGNIIYSTEFFEAILLGDHSVVDMEAYHELSFAFVQKKQTIYLKFRCQLRSDDLLYCYFLTNNICIIVCCV